MTALVVIVSFNSGKSLQRCVEAVLEQTYENKTVVVVDNASSDNQSLTVLDNLAREQKVYLKRLTDNAGYGAAINLAVREWPDSQFIACLNADAFPDKNWLSELIAVAESEERIASVGSLMVQAHNANRLDGAGDALGFTGYPHRLGYGADLATADRYPAEIFSACAGACLYRRSAFEQVHGFDDSFFMYVEDVDLGFRLRLAGFENRLCHTALAHHIGSESAGYRSGFYTFFGHRNTELMLWKCLPAPLFLLVGPIHFLAVVALLPVMARRGRLRTYYRAKWAALRLLGTTRQARATVSVSCKSSAILKAMTLHWRRK